MDVEETFSVTSIVVSIALWWNLCRVLEVFRSSVSEQLIMYAVGLLCRLLVML